MNIIWLGIWIGLLGGLAYHKTSREIAATVLVFALLFSWIFAPVSWLFLILTSLLVIGILIPIFGDELRIQHITKPCFYYLQGNLPKISKTEKEAILAGTVAFDGELFSGHPNWKKFLNKPLHTLTAEEQDFLNGPVETLCKMANDWEMMSEQAIPDNLWNFLKENGFFGLIIPKNYGGLEFSALAHSDILAKVASRSLSVATLIAVPNSLGPAELILKYGTQHQKDHYLPRLANGSEIPCFALTGPYAGSDATSIPDKGTIKRGHFAGKECVGIQLNWDKRYITLAPIATLIGLAFKLYDPDHLLGEKTELGITCALLPVNLPGITIGRHHKPLTALFPNGPIQGKDVFIPIDYIIGGPSMAGLGWKMLVECLSHGRAISLPSSATGAIKKLAAVSGAYSRIRKQFKKSIGHFEGIEEPLARLAGNAYLADAARIMTVNYLDDGETPTVLGAIIKYQLTERARNASIDAMDIHGGKGIMQGPRNYLAQGYFITPIMITVEGANILTRSMIIFGQGLLRSHPYLLDELKVLEESNLEETQKEWLIKKFDLILQKHIAHILSGFTRSIWMGLTQIGFPSNPIAAINRASSAFAFITDACLLLLGGKLKNKEKLSGRFADMLSMMYLASCTVKFYHSQGKPKDFLAVHQWVMHHTLNSFWEHMEDLLHNLPNHWIGLILRRIVMPFGKPNYKPTDKLGKKVAEILISPNTARDKLIQGIYLTPDVENIPGQLETALQKIVESELNESDHKLKIEAERLKEEVIAVDDF